MRSVYISPQFNSPDAGDGGIRRVVEAMRRHLPSYGWQVVENVKDADLINCHAAALVDYSPTIPMVASCHGLYWSNYRWPDEFYDANQLVIETMIRAQHITAPSRWVAHALSYGLLKPITPIHHGIDPDEWDPDAADGSRRIADFLQANRYGENYVLWNKARSDVISNHADLDQLARIMPDTRFVTTIGNAALNVAVVGRLPYHEMKSLVRHAGVFLATARETFGIGTLEALAAGVPVVGWNFGGQSEIVRHGETGYLVEYGDYEGLAEAVSRALELRESMSPVCRQDAALRWGWPGKIAQYAAVFDQVYEAWHQPRPKVSFIITCHNLGRYLDECLASVSGSPLTDFEAIIVDDDSHDDSGPIARRWVERDSRFRYLKPDRNLGLSGARNFGIQHSTGRYILPLDADDRLNPKGLAPLIKALDSDHGVHIAYGNLRMISDDGKKVSEQISSPGAAYDWLGQMAHINQLYYCALIRREVFEWSGGYRVRDWRAEDAAMWCRLTSLGFRAEKVTEEPTIFYRVRGDSKSQAERQRYPDADGDWTAWYGWRLAGNAQAGRQAMAQHRVPNPMNVPFGAQGKPPSDVRTWNIDHRQEPLISVIIPVGPGHDRYLVDTLDSLTAQTFGDWEAVVVNDTGQPLNLTPWPWARLVETTGRCGAGAARNAGIEAARGQLIYFLDADDWLLSNCLLTVLDAWLAHDGQHYVYTNYMSVDQHGKVKHEKLKPFQQRNWRGQHAINILMAREDALKVGGFDEDLPGWEDWDFLIKLSVGGICGVFAPVETFVYRFHSGGRRQTAADEMDDLLPILKDRYDDYYTGVKQIMACGGGCGSTAGGAAILKAKQDMGLYRASVVTSYAATNGNGHGRPTMTRMEYIGQNPGVKTFIRVNGKSLSRVYQGANNPVHRYTDAAPDDVPLLVESGLWRVLVRPQEATTESSETTNTPAPVAINYAPPVATEEPLPDMAVRVADAINATPGAIREADAAGLDLATISGSGPSGRITVADVRAAVRSHA